MEHNALITPEQISARHRIGGHLQLLYRPCLLLRRRAVRRHRGNRTRGAFHAHGLGDRCGRGGVLAHRQCLQSPIGPFRASVEPPSVSGNDAQVPGVLVGERTNLRRRRDQVPLRSMPPGSSSGKTKSGASRSGNSQTVTVVSQNPTRIPADDWMSIEVVDTYLAGELIAPLNLGFLFSRNARHPFPEVLALIASARSIP